MTDSILSDHEVERLVLAVGAGMGTFTDEDCERAARWAKGVRVAAAVLDLVLAGELVVVIPPDRGEPEFMCPHERGDVMPRPTSDLAPTWWMLVELDLPELSGHRLRAIGPLSWTDVRALGERWEQAFGAGTTAFTERPAAAARRVAVGVRSMPVQAACAAPSGSPVDRAAVAATPVPAPRALPARRRVKVTTPAEVAAFRSGAPGAVSVVGGALLERIPAPRAAAKRRVSGPSRLSPQARAALAGTRAARTLIDAALTEEP